MAFQLPAPIDNSNFMAEILRKRLEALQGPTPWQQLGPAITGATQNITQGVTEGLKNRSVKQAQELASEYQTLPAEVKNLPSVKAKYNEALFTMGIKPPELTQEPISMIEAKARAESKGKEAGITDIYGPGGKPGQHGDMPLTQGQLEALGSEDPATIAKSFPNEKVPLQALRFGTGFRSQQAQQKERESKRLERRSDEKLKIVDRFNADTSVKKSQQSIDAANNIRALVNSENPIAANAIPTYMARASGEVGNLSEGDKKPFGGSAAILSRLRASATQVALGKLTQENAEFITELANLMEKRANDNIEKLARTRSKQYSRASEFLKENDIYESLRPIVDIANPATGKRKYEIIAIE